MVRHPFGSQLTDQDEIQSTTFQWLASEIQVPFSDMTLSVTWQEGQQACKTPAIYHKRFFGEGMQSSLTLLWKKASQANTTSWVCVCVNKQLYEQQVLYTFSVCDRFHVFAEVHCRLDYIKMTNWIKIINNTHTRKKHTNWYKITTPNNTEETLQNITANTKIKH